MIPRIGMAAYPEMASLLVPLLQAQDFKVTVIWCKSNEAARQIADNYNIPFCVSQFSELLLHSEVDIVYVATEPVQQAEIAVKALTSGKHCICQKPPCISQTDAEKIVSLSQYYSQLVNVLESHLRFVPAFVKMRELVASGYCGQLLVLEARVAMGSLVQGEAYSWQCDRSVGGGALNTIGSHLIDLATFVTGQRAAQVHACLRTFKPHTETIGGYRRVASDDFGCFQMQCDGGLYSSVTINTHWPGTYRMEFSVSGADGRLTVRGMDLFGSRGLDPETALLEQTKEEAVIKDPPSKFPPDYYDIFEVGLTGMLRALREAFVGTGVTPDPGRFRAMATFEDGLYIRTVLDTLHESSRIGRWMPVPTVSTPGNMNPFWTGATQYVPTEKP